MSPFSLTNASPSNERTSLSTVYSEHGQGSNGVTGGTGGSAGIEVRSELEKKNRRLRHLLMFTNVFVNHLLFY